MWVHIVLKDIADGGLYSWAAKLSPQTFEVEAVHCLGGTGEYVYQGSYRQEPDLCSVDWDWLGCAYLEDYRMLYKQTNCQRRILTEVIYDKPPFKS